MSPVAFAIVFIIFTLGAVAAYVLLLRQAGLYEMRYEIQLEALRHRVWRVTARAELAEAIVRELRGDNWEQEEFWAIAAELRSDEGGAA